MKDNFVIERKPKVQKQPDSNPPVRISRDKYNMLVDWALQSNSSLSAMAEKAIAFANEHAVFVDSE